MTIEDRAPGIAAISPAIGGRTADELEFEAGQSWFAKTGIVVLAIGDDYTASLSFANLPPTVPSLTRCGFDAGLFALACF